MTKAGEYHLFLFPISGILLFETLRPLAKKKKKKERSHFYAIYVYHYIKSFYFSLFCYHMKTITNYAK